MSGVYSEEQAIFRAQQLELIYSQSGMLYKYLPNAPRSKLDLSKPKPGPHGDGLVGSVSSSAASLLSQLQQLSLQSAPSGQAVPADSSPSQSLSINAVQASDPKGNQQSDGKKKGRNNKKKGKNGKGNANKTNERVGEGQKEKKKVKFPCKLCAGDHLTHLCPKIQDAQRLLSQQGSSSSQAVLTNPFPQGQQLIAGANQNPGASSGGPQEGEIPSNIFMMNAHVDVATRSRDYGGEESSKAKEVPDATEPLHITKPTVESMPRVPKASSKRSTINPNMRAAQNYSIVEDLAQSPCAMSALEVLQSCPAQRSALLTAIGAIDPKNSLLITFDMKNFKKRLPHHMAFHIKSSYRKTNIFRTVVDEGASTCVMSLACWKTLGSPKAVPSSTVLTAFDGHSHRPHGIVPALPICVGGKTVNIEVEVVDAALDYNLLLGRNWIYDMDAIASSLFRIVCFPHEGRIVTVDQLDCPPVDLDAPPDSSVPKLDNTKAPVENLGVGMYSSLMGSFDLPPPKVSINAISSSKAPLRREFFRTHYFSDPWTLPSPTATLEEGQVGGMAFPISAAEIAYQSVVDTAESDPAPLSPEELDGDVAPAWTLTSSSAQDCLDTTLPSEEAILEAMTGIERPWDDLHHRSYFLPDLSEVEASFPSPQSPGPVHPVLSPLAPAQVYAEGNMAVISPTIPVNISRNPNIIENVFIGAECSHEEVQIYTELFKEYRDVFAWSYEEMPGIDPSIVQHEIKTYENAKPVRQKLRPVNPRKAAAIKAEVEKLLKAGFIFPVPLTEWVSNPVPVDKKQGTIRVCIDFRDLNKACPKDNYPTPFIDQIIDECAGNEIFSFMDGFSGYNQITIRPEDQHKTAFICPWGTFAYKKMPFGLKNAGATFQRAMSYAFHDIKKIIEAYLDDLAAHSRKRIDHPGHLRQIFERCRFYKIRLNPNKCVFAVTSGRLLGFIVSREGIRVDPFKVEAILRLPPPSSIRQLQSLQGKSNFLRRFIVNYAEITKGYMRLLKKGVPFLWDDYAQRSFDALKKALTSAPLLSPPDYSRDFLLYLATAESTIGMVLVQEDDALAEHVIYYLSRGLVGPELRYTPIEKLALAAVHAVQRLRHYIILRKTYVLAAANPFQFVLSRRVIGGKYNRWIVILQEFDLEFMSAKSKKSLVFAELISELPCGEEMIYDESFPDEHLFLISPQDPWYGDIIVYLQTAKFPSSFSKDERRKLRHLAKSYLIIGDALYRRGVDSILRRCLTFEEAEAVLNDSHGGACGGHLSGLATAQKILRAGYFWPSIFKDCIESVKKCHPCQVYTRKMRAHPAPLFPVVTVGPFTKWGMDYTTCNPPSAKGHKYIIVAVDYFTKWVEAMPTFGNDGETAALFFFNQVIARFGIPREIVTDHGSHFQNSMMAELALKLGFRQEHSSPYYPQANGQVEAVNKSLKTILQRTIDKHRSNWHIMLYPALWAYRTSVKTATGFTPFQLVHGVESVFPIECEIPSLKLAVELLPDTSSLAERLLHLEHLDEQRRDAATLNEAHKNRVKVQYDKAVKPRVFSEGDLVLVYAQEKDALGAGKFKSMWYGPYIVKKVLKKGAYTLVDFEGNELPEPRNGLYLKKYYA